MSEAVPEDDDRPAEPEPDEPDEDEDEADEADEAESAHEPPTDMAMERAYQAIERKAQNYSKGQAAMLRETGLEWEACVCCAVPGFVLPYQPENPDDQHRKLMVDSYFHATEPEYKPADDREACPKCDGWGQVLSGSRADQHRVVPCSRCNGTGYVVKTDPALALAQQQPPPPPGQFAGATGNGEAHAPDFWQRPWGHPDYGTPPAFINAGTVG